MVPTVPLVVACLGLYGGTYWLLHPRATICSAGVEDSAEHCLCTSPRWKQPYCFDDGLATIGCNELLGKKLSCSDGDADPSALANRCFRERGVSPSELAFRQCSGGTRKKHTCASVLAQVGQSTSEMPSLNLTECYLGALARCVIHPVEGAPSRAVGASPDAGPTPSPASSIARRTTPSTSITTSEEDGAVDSAEYLGILSGIRSVGEAVHSDIARLAEEIRSVGSSFQHVLRFMESVRTMTEECVSQDEELTQVWTTSLPTTAATSTTTTTTTPLPNPPPSSPAEALSGLVGVSERPRWTRDVSAEKVAAAAVEGFGARLQTLLESSAERSRTAGARSMERALQSTVPRLFAESMRTVREELMQVPVLWIRPLFERLEARLAGAEDRSRKSDEFSERLLALVLAKLREFAESVDARLGELDRPRGDCREERSLPDVLGFLTDDAAPYWTLVGLLAAAGGIGLAVVAACQCRGGRMQLRIVNELEGARKTVVELAAQMGQLQESIAELREMTVQATLEPDFSVVFDRDEEGREVPRILLHGVNGAPDLDLGMDPDQLSEFRRLRGYRAPVPDIEEEVARDDEEVDGAAALPRQSTLADPEQTSLFRSRIEVVLQSVGRRIARSRRSRRTDGEPPLMELRTLRRQRNTEEGGRIPPPRPDPPAGSVDDSPV